MPQIANPLAAGPVSEKQIREFETSIGSSLPDDYRAFLLEFNGGQPQPGGFCYDSQEPNDSVWCFFPLREFNKEDISTSSPDDLYVYPIQLAYADLLGALEEMCDEMEIEEFEEELLPIGTDGNGNYVCLDLKEGGILFYDHETWERSPLASSFEEFLGGLAEYDPEA